MPVTNTFSAPVTYAPAVIGAVTQITSRSTAVTINSGVGVITTDVTNIGTGATASFIVNNSFVTASSKILATVVASGSALTVAQIPALTISAIGAGVFTINVASVGSGNLAGITILFQVLS